MALIGHSFCGDSIMDVFYSLKNSSLRQKLEKLPKPISHIYTLLVVLIGWVFFMSPNITTAFSITWKNDRYRQQQPSQTTSQVYVKILFYIIRTRHSTQYKSL